MYRGKQNKAQRVDVTRRLPQVNAGIITLCSDIVVLLKSTSLWKCGLLRGQEFLPGVCFLLKKKGRCLNQKPEIRGQALRGRRRDSVFPCMAQAKRAPDIAMQTLCF